MSGSRRGLHFSRPGRIAAAAAIALFVLGAVFAVWGDRGSAVFAQRSDPSHTYTVEFVTARNIERLLHPSTDMPGFARLVRIKDGRIMGTSDVVDFFGGGNADVIWLIGQNGTVQVGRDVVFQHVPPVDEQDGIKR